MSQLVTIEVLLLFRRRNRKRLRADVANDDDDAVALLIRQRDADVGQRETLATPVKIFLHQF